MNRKNNNKLIVGNRMTIYMENERLKMVNIMSKRIYFLNDMTENCVDAVIIAKTSTKEEIESAIDKAKEIDAYTWDDIVEVLPSDCEVYDRWNNDMIYY